MSIDPMDAAIRLAELALDLASGARSYDEEVMEEMKNLASVILG